MEPVIVGLVLVVLVVLFLGVSYLYMREAGSDGARLWFTGSDRLRASIRAFGSSGATVSLRSMSQAESASPTPMPTVAEPRQLSALDMARALEDDAMRELKEEIQRELRVAVGRTREFDVRLTRIEQTTGEMPDLSAELSRELDLVREAQRAEMARVKASLDVVRQQAGSWGERRGEVLSELYGSLARVESALAAVVNPMLLPGEPLSLPADLPVEAMEWKSWGDVGERAYAFGNIFNENRLVLPRETADEIELFIGTLRHALTGSVYPAVRGGKPGADLMARMRSGLDEIVAGLPAVRRPIEPAHRNGDGATEQ